jgi:hypothetical protein
MIIVEEDGKEKNRTRRRGAEEGGTTGKDGHFVSEHFVYRTYHKKKRLRESRRMQAKEQKGVKE